MNPAMLPVGEAETVGAKINTNAERRVHKIEASLDRFIAASVGILGMPMATEPRAFQAPEISKPKPDLV
jgi:hypothetical protein